MFEKTYMSIYIVKDSFTPQQIRRYRVRDLLAALLISRAPYFFPFLHFRYLSNGHYKDNNF
jgi:hypothetical protein